jgi:hypothetical protein
MKERESSVKKKEHIEFVFTFEYDSKRIEDFESIWNLGFKMLKLLDDYVEDCDSCVKAVVNESSGATVHRKLASA